VDFNLAGRRVGENSTRLFSWHWPGDDGSILQIVTSIINMTMWVIVNAAIAGLPDRRWKIRKLYGCWEEPNGDGSLQSHIVTPFMDNNTAARWVKTAMKLNNAALFCIVCRGKLADCPAGVLMPMHCGRSYHPLHIHPPTSSEG